MWRKSGAHNTSSLVTESAPTCTGRLCRDPVLCGSGSTTKMMNSEEDQSRLTVDGIHHYGMVGYQS